MSVAKKMETSLTRYLRPELFEDEPNVTASDLKWKHWRSTFENFLVEECSDIGDSKKLKLLVNHLSPSIYCYIQACETYVDAMTLLETIYIKPKNVILARHLLTIRKQRSEETIKEYVQALKLLALDCRFEQVTAEEYKNESTRGAFIAGINSQKIREWLLEKLDMSLDEAVNLAISLENAEKNNHAFTGVNSTSTPLNLNAASDSRNNAVAPAVNFRNIAKRRCFFCGGNVHKRMNCPALNKNCQLCSKKGHLANVYRSGQPQKANAVTEDNDDVVQQQQYTDSLSAISAASPNSLRKATVCITINSCKAEALIDTGSSVSFIDRNLAQRMKIKMNPCSQTVTLASRNHVSFVQGIWSCKYST